MSQDSAAHPTIAPVSYEPNFSDEVAVSVLHSHEGMDGNMYTTSDGETRQLRESTEDSIVYTEKRIVYRSSASSTIDKVTVYAAKPLDLEKNKDEGEAWLSREVEVTVKRLYSGRRLGMEKSEKAGRIDYYYDSSGDMTEEPCKLELILSPGSSNVGNTGQDMIASNVTKKDFNGTIMEFNCTGVGGSVLYVKTNSTTLNITDVEIQGDPGADVFLIQPSPSSPQSNEVYHHVTLKEGLKNTAVALQENSQYLEDRSLWTVYNLTFTSTRDSEVYRLFTVYLSPKSGVTIEGCVDQEVRHFDMPPGVCDGTKVEGKWNTWAIDLDRPHLVVHCHGNEVVKMDLSGDCNNLSLLSHDTHDMLIGFTLLEEPGFLSLDINHYSKEETEYSLSCRDTEEEIVAECAAEYHLYDEKGVWKSEAEFLRSSIMEAFNNSLSFQILLKTIEEQARRSTEEDWMADHYPAYLETEFEKARDTPEMRKLLEVEKAEIILKVKREVRDRQHQEINRYFKEASMFYKKMASLLQEAMTMVASSNQKSLSKQMDQENTADSIIRSGTDGKLYPSNLLEMIGDVIDKVSAKIGSKESTESEDTEERDDVSIAPIGIEFITPEPAYKTVALHFIHYYKNIHFQM